MCGIFGVVNGSKNRSSRSSICNFFSDAFIASQVRGVDSSGLFQLRKNIYHHHKLPVDGTTFVAEKFAKEYFFAVDSARATVGHVRAATAGKVATENAHPFFIQGPKETDPFLVGCHNGTLSSWRGKEGASKFDVDSKWALNLIHLDGIKAFEKFDGAYSFVWAASETQDTLHMARNKERPMYYAYEKNKDVMLFASEHGMLAWLADRNDIVLEDKIYTTQTDYLYEFNIDNPREFKKEKLPAYKYDVSRSAGTGDTFAQTAFFNRVFKDIPLITAANKSVGNTIVGDLLPAVVQLPQGNKVQVLGTITQDEKDLAELFKGLGLKCSITIEARDDVTGDVYCTLLDAVDPAEDVDALRESVYGIIRSVPKATYEILVLRKANAATIVGATEELFDSGKPELAYLLSVPFVTELETIQSMTDKYEKQATVH